MKKFLYIALAFMVLSGSCKKQLEEKVFSELDPQTFLKTRDGIEAVLGSAYSFEANMTGENTKFMLAIEDEPTDIMWQTGGGENGFAIHFINFTWDPSISRFHDIMWLPYFRAIRDANAVLDEVDNAEITASQKESYKNEARFVRVAAYYRLYNLFGPVPIRKSNKDPLSVPRPSDDDMKKFIETELLEIIPKLPAPGSEPAYGRAHSAAARSFLMRFYLNTRQWQKSADQAKAIIDLNKYALYPNYVNLFKVENERNNEFIWIKAANVNSTNINDWVSAAFPAGFARDPASGITFLSTWRNFASQYRLLDVFYNSFAAADKRKGLILTSYVNAAGQTISLLNNNDTRSLKYWPDPNAANGLHGNDVPVFRYADVLLSRAEALNEINGPNAESISLVNLVRARAELPPVQLQGFPTKEDFRDHVLKERGWEFYSEGKRREDLIRMNRFISGAQARGKTAAQPYKTLFPIPQQALDADPQLTQNQGY
jgi:hypothetical protein